MRFSMDADCATDARSALNNNGQSLVRLVSWSPLRLPRGIYTGFPVRVCPSQATVVAGVNEKGRPPKDPPRRSAGDFIFRRPMLVPRSTNQISTQSSPAHTFV